jgi:acyl-CoA synthetase (AMP-forming)/AMP-acid ligase II
MFHVNAWGLPYVAPMLGAKLVLPGPRLDPASVYELFENEAVEYSAGVPTVWAWLLAYVRAQGLRFSTLRALGVGGSAVPASMIQAFENDYGVEMLQGWGMTETSPVCSLGILKRKHEQSAERIAYRAKAGRFVYGVQTKIVDDAGNVLPRDGVAQGELLVRGPWVASSYFDDPEATEAKFTADGWLRTGDIVSIDPDGYLTIRDRSKDVIKSGGEWISSIDLENVAVAHPDVAEGRGDRRAPSRLVGAADPGRHTEARDQAGSRQHPRVSRRQDRLVVDAGRRGLRRRPAAHGDR